MNIKLTIGKKTYYFLAILWTFLAIVNFVKGEFQVGMLMVLIALHDYRDARRGEEVVAFQLQTNVKGRE